MTWSLSASPRVAGSRIAGIGASQPTRPITAQRLADPFGRDGDWVTRRTGIRELRRAATAEDMLSHARAAAHHALQHAGAAAADVDLLIVASCSLVGREPVCTALAADIAPRAAAMDLNAACSGFSYALDVADGAIRAGAARIVLIVAAEWMSGLIDPRDLGTSIIFGDGAGAAVVRPVESGPPGVWPAVYGSAGDGAHLIRAVHDEDGLRLRMEGAEVFRWAVETVPKQVVAACDRAGLQLGDIDVLVLHQANLRIIDAVAKQLGLRADVVVADDVTRSGNTSAASIPIALSEVMAAADLEGSIAVIAGFGAGLSFSAQAVRLPARAHDEGRPRLGTEQPSRDEQLV